MNPFSKLLSRSHSQLCQEVWLLHCICAYIRVQRMMMMMMMMRMMNSKLYCTLDYSESTMRSCDGRLIMEQIADLQCIHSERETKGRLQVGHTADCYTYQVTCQIPYLIAYFWLKLRKTHVGLPRVLNTTPRIVIVLLICTCR